MRKMILGFIIIILVSFLGCDKNSTKPNNPPTTPTITARATTVESGDTASLTASATDPDGDPLTYTWSATGGSFNTSSGASVVWTSPAVSDTEQYAISVEAKDDEGASASNSVNITVTPRLVIFYEGFESYTTGTFPSPPWSPLYNAVSEPENNIVTDLKSFTGQKSLQLYGSHWGGWSAETSHPRSFPDTVIIQWAMMASEDIFNSSGWPVDMLLGMGYAYYPSGAYYHALAHFRKDSNIHGIGGEGDILQSYQPWVWYRIKAKVYFIEKKVDYWINGVYIGTHPNPNLFSSSTYTHLHLGNGGGKGWIDDIRIER